MMFYFGKNVVTEKDGFYISYNPITDKGPETAICKDGMFYILLGDHQDEYKDKTYEECIEYFKKNEELMSFWSDLLED